MLIKYFIFIYLLSNVNCYLINKIIINNKIIIIKETYNGKFVENYKYINKNVIIKETYNGKFLENYKYCNKYNNKNLRLKDYNLYLDK